MKGRCPSVALRGALSATLILAVVVHAMVHVATGGKSWREFVSQTPITPAWWSDATLQLVAFFLQLVACVYSCLPVGYSIDQKKTVLVEAVGLPWILQWLSLVAADVLHLAMGSGPVALMATSLAGSVAGFAALYGCLRKIHPLMVRVRRAESAMRDSSAVLVRAGTRWATAYFLFRLPTSITAGLCAVRAATDVTAYATTVFGVDFNRALNPSLGLLLVVMVLGVAMLNHLEEVAFSLTILLWLLGLIVATHTLLIVKGFCIALVMALAMRTAFKYIPDEEYDTPKRQL